VYPRAAEWIALAYIPMTFAFGPAGGSTTRATSPPSLPAGRAAAAIEIDLARRWIDAG